MTNNMITREALISRWTENGWEDLSVTCPDGVTVNIHPCSYGDIRKIEDCDYFLVDGDMPYMGGDNLDRVIDELNRHAELVEESNKAKAQLQAFYDDHERNGWDEESYSEYSDWYKSWYGYRPRFDWAEHNKAKKTRRYTEDELTAFVLRADSLEKCDIAREYIQKLPYVGDNAKERLFNLLASRAAKFVEDPFDDYDDYYEDRGSYSPSAPWNAPGMKVSDFITGVCF